MKDCCVVMRSVFTLNHLSRKRCRCVTTGMQFGVRWYDFPSLRLAVHPGSLEGARMAVAVVIASCQHARIHVPDRMPIVVNALGQQGLSCGGLAE